MNRENNPTLRDIARACGASVCTVSYALRDNAKISAQTRRRIQATARRLGWKPNPLAGAYMAHLRSTRTPSYQATLAYLISFPGVDQFENLPEAHRRHFRGAAERAASLGYSLEPLWFRDLNSNLMQLARLLKSRGIPGFIINGQHLPPNALSAFPWNSYAAAAWGFYLNIPLHRAACNYAHGIRTALHRIRELGYTRVAMSMSTFQDNLAGNAFLSMFYYDEKHRGAQGWPKSHVIYAEDAATEKKLRRWLEKNRPDVVIGDSFTWHVLERMGWKVPADIAFVSLWWSHTWKQIGGIDNQPEVVGANSVDLVSAQIMRNERGLSAAPKLLLSDSRWVDGPSVPPKNTRAKKLPFPRSSAPNPSGLGRNDLPI